MTGPHATFDAVNQSRSHVLVVDADLMALSRIREAASRAQREVTTANGDSLGRVLADTPADLLILDLDRGGTDLVRKAQEATADAEDLRVVGFYSHIDTELGQSAREAGFETFPRGVFWRSLDEVLVG
jgi:DNA-binding response OmpR family regulator